MAEKFVNRKVKNGKWQYGHANNHIGVLKRFLATASIMRNGRLRRKRKFTHTMVY